MRRLIPFLTFISVVVLAQPARADQTVSILTSSFMPASLTATLGETITFDNTAGVGHTSTSDDGFWNTGTISPGANRDVPFVSAGTFPYHCSIHPFMQAEIAVPVRVHPAGPVVAGKKIRIVFASQTASGRTYVVERQRGSGAWTMMTVPPGSLSIIFKPKKPGTYRFHAAVVLNGVTSAFSPDVAVKVKPA